MAMGYADVDDDEKLLMSVSVCVCSQRDVFANFKMIG